MSKTLTEIAEVLRDTDKKVQLIYAFNGSGKTRLSREFKQLVAPKNVNVEDEEQIEPPRTKILYYNAFTEDLFYWDNDLEFDAEPKLRIQANTFTDWIFKSVSDQGMDQRIVSNFQRFTDDKLTPKFNEEYKYTEDGPDKKETTIPAFSEVTFTLERGDDTSKGKIKISQGEESNFVWSIFYTLLEEIVTSLNSPSDSHTRSFTQLEYVFIDDPVSSLDENHLIELAVSLATLIKSQSTLKFIITTHNPLFYNVLYSELETKTGYMLEKLEDGTFSLSEKLGDSNKSFSYHLYLKQTLEKAIASNQVEKYHFMLLRNLYEKTASFLGYPRWSELLPDDKQIYLKRIIQFTSHSTLSNEAVAVPTAQEKQTVKFLLDHLANNYGYWPKKEESNG